VVDVSDRVTPDYLVTVADLTDWESRHGRIPPGSILLLRTGWGERWPDPIRFLGTDKKGPEAVPELHFPGLSPDAAQWIVDNRDIDAIGIDTPSIDYGQSATFETHQILYAENMPGLENVANLEQVPEWGAYVVALPMKIAGGSGGPLRVVAFIPEPAS
jgi:kynurenine formamidase